MNRISPLLALALFAAGCGGGGGSSAPGPLPQPITTAAPLIIGAIGDSITAGYVDPTGVTYYTDAAHSYVGLAAAQIGATLVDPAVPSMPCSWMVANEVPQIPAGAAFVIVNCGANELRQGDPTAFVDFDNVIAAVRAQAPRAHLVIVDERNLATPPGNAYTVTPAMVTAWNTHEQTVAASVGATFFDIQNNAAVYGANWPDNLHPDEAGAQALAAIVFPRFRSRTGQIVAV